MLKMDIQISYIIVVLILLFFSGFAAYNEYKHHEDAYSFFSKKDTDTILSSIRKIDTCLKYEQKSVRWRRILICTTAVIFLLFAFVHQELPSVKQIILYFFIIFLVFYFNWINYSNFTCTKAANIGAENLKHLKQTLNQKENNFYGIKLDVTD